MFLTPTVAASRTPQAEDSSIKRKRAINPAWEEFEGVGNLAPVACGTVTCRYCAAKVSSHRHLDRAKEHLANCEPYLQHLKANFQPEEWPEFIDAQRTQAVKRRNQPSLLKYAIPKPSTEDQNIFQESIAMFFYTSGSAFYRAENEYLDKAIQKIRPGARLPTRRDLSGSLLEICYNNVQAKVMTEMEASKNYFTLTTDMWTNVTGEPIANYSAVSTVRAIYLESPRTGKNRHTGEYIASEILRVFAKYPCNWIGACTDNAANNQSAWKILSSKHPEKYFYGCFCHGLHLIVKSLLCLKECPANSPFRYLCELAERASKVVTYFKRHHIANVTLVEEQGLSKVNSLKLAGDTRWGSYSATFKSLKDSFRILEDTVRSDVWNGKGDAPKGTAKEQQTRAEIKHIVARSGEREFEAELAKALAILGPIDKYIKVFQSNTVPLSDCYAAIVKMRSAYTVLARTELTGEEHAYLKNLLSDRWRFLYTPAHGISYLMDPRYLGEGLNRGDQDAILKDLAEYPEVGGEVVKLVPESEQLRRLTDYNTFRAYALEHKTNNTLQFKLYEKENRTPLSFWMDEGKEWPTIQPLAVRIFHLCCTSCESERAFSALGFIHSKQRNRLKPERADKLAFIKGNCKIAAVVSEPDDIFDCDDSDAVEGLYSHDEEDGVSDSDSYS